MRNKIEQLLKDKLVVSGSGMSILGVKDASNELLQLMCYREVSAIMEWVGVKFFDDPHLEDALLFQLKEQYDVKIIWQAIEQVKRRPPVEGN